MTSTARYDAPAPDEYSPAFAAYVGRVPPGDIVETLSRQLGDTLHTLAPVTTPHGGYRYAEGKWSIKQVVGHLADAERVFAYRLMCVARGEQQSLPGFDEDAYVAGAGFDELSMSQLTELLGRVRHATTTLLETLPTSAWTKRGTANGKAVSVRALAHVIAGHELHHRQVLRERYLPAVLAQVARAP